MIIVKHNQTLLDIAYQYGKSYLSIIDYAFENKISIDGVLNPKQELIQPQIKSYDTEITLINSKVISPKNYKVIVKQNQNLCDLAVQENGSIFSLLELAYENKITLDYQIEPKEFINNKTSAEFYDEDIARYFKEKSIIISTRNKSSFGEDYSLPLGFPISF